MGFGALSTLNTLALPQIVPRSEHLFLQQEGRFSHQNGHLHLFGPWQKRPHISALAGSYNSVEVALLRPPNGQAALMLDRTVSLEPMRRTAGSGGCWLRVANRLCRLVLAQDIHLHMGCLYSGFILGRE